MLIAVDRFGLLLACMGWAVVNFLCCCSPEWVTMGVMGCPRFVWITLCQYGFL